MIDTIYGVCDVKLLYGSTGNNTVVTFYVLP